MKLKLAPVEQSHRFACRKKCSSSCNVHKEREEILRLLHENLNPILAIIFVQDNFKKCNPSL